MPERHIWGRVRGAMVAAILVLAACSGGSGSGSPSSGDGELVTPEEFVDLETELPDDVSGIDLGEFEPTAATFCEAFGGVPMHWINDAVVPLQFWIDSYDDVTDVPEAARKPLAALQQFAEFKMAWNFKRIEERPVYDETMALQALALADAAVAACPALPLVPGPDGYSDPPGWWADEPDSSIESMCAASIADVDNAVAAYAERRGQQPQHFTQLDAEAFHAYAFGDGDLFVGSDYHGIEIDADGRVVAAVVPGGGCDR